MTKFCCMMETQEFEDMDSSHPYSEEDVRRWISLVKEDPDFVIELEDLKICCHQSVLKKASLYFEALFSSQMRESESKHVKLENTEKQPFLTLLKFAYARQLDLSEETMYCVTAAASMYQFSLALVFAQQFLGTKLTSDTWPKILQFAETHDLEHAYFAALRYILWYFPKEVEKHMENFQMLPLSLLSKVLGHSLLNCDSETGVIRTLSAWSEYEGNEGNHTAQDLADVFSTSVRLNDLCERELDEVLNLEFVQKHPAIQEMVQRKIDHRDSSETPPEPRTGPFIMMSVYGQIDNGKTKRPANNIYRIDPETGHVVEHAHHVVAFQGTNTTGFKACCVDADLYITGGETVLGRNTWQMDVWKFSGFLQTWTKVTQLLQPRRHHGTCALHRDIYLIGGIGKFRQVLDSVEKYNTQTRQWTTLSPLLQSEFSPATVVCQGNVYVLKNSLQRYCPAADQWTTLTVGLPFNLGFYSAVSVGSTIFMKCHYDGRLVQLETDSEKMSAKVMAEFTSSVDGELVKHRKRIYCLGGEDSAECAPLEFYSLKDNKVLTEQTMDLALSAFSVVPMPYFPCPL